MSRAFNIPAVASRGLLSLALLAVFVGVPAAAMGQDPVQDLRKLLRKPDIDPTLPADEQQEAFKAYNERGKRGAKLIDDRLRSFAQLRQALLLKEWEDMAKTQREDPAALATDARLRAQIAKRFRAKVHAVVEHGDNDSKAAVANLITELGLTVRSAIDADKLLKLDRLSKLEKATPEEEVERDRLLLELENDRRPGFARSMTEDVIRLTESDSEFVRLHALRALAGINPDPKRAAPIFGAKLTSSPDVQARRIAADGLSRLVGISEYLEDELRLKRRPVWTERVELLVTCAEVVKQAPKGLNDVDAVVRSHCAEALKASAQVLMAQFQRPPDEKKDLQGKKDLKAVVKNFPPGEINAIKDILKAFHDAGPRLAGALKDPSAEVRLGAVHTLERLSDVRYRLAEVPVNVGAFGKAANRTYLVPPQASDPLTNFAQGDWRAVTRLLEDPDVHVRRGAVYFLEFFPEARPGAVPDLIKALADSDRFVRWGAARALGSFSKGYRPEDAVPAVPTLARLLFDSDFFVRQSAAASLEALGVYAETAGPELIRAVSFGDVENRVAVLYVIQSVGPDHSKAAIGSVTDALDHPDPRVRRAAAETLGKYGSIARNKTTIDALRRALGDEDQDARINASEALLQILDDGSIGKE
jgi:HEAT repeat protein